MDFPFGAVGSLLGAGLNFLSGSNAQGQQSQQFQQSAMAQQQQLAFQQAAAQYGIRWRVNDAKAAGISPLVALGAPTFSPGPIGLSAGGVPSSGVDYSNALGRAGQDISQAVGRTMTQQEKLQMAFTQQKMIDDHAKSQAEINALNAQANANNARAFSNPPMPGTGYSIPGQTQSGVAGPFVTKPVEVLASQPGAPGAVGGRAAPADQAYATKNGLVEFQPAPGSPASQGDVFNSALNFARNRLQPNWTRSDEDRAAIMRGIKSVYPDAVAYEPMGFGYYRPIYPAEAVRIPVRRNVRAGY